METSADSDSNDLSIPASPLQGQRAATVALPAGLVEMSGAGDAKQRIAVLGPAASRWSERDVAGLAGSLPIAQGLAMGAGIGVMPIGTLDALAAQIQEGEVIAAMDARMGELYWARFRCSKGIPFPLGEPECVSPSNWQPVLGSVCSGIGSAFKAHRDALNPGIFTGLVSIFDDRTPRANEIARLAADRRYAAAAIDPALAAPLYVRYKVARTTVERLSQGGKA